MKLSIQREELLTPLQLVIGVVERKQTLPILSNVLLETKGNKMSVTGTDLEVELVSSVNLETSSMQDAQLTIPGRKLMDICRALPEDAQIVLYQDQEQIILSSGRSRFTLSTLPAVDFPNIDQHEELVRFKVSQKGLRYLLQRSHFAIAQQDVRAYLNGLLFEINNNQLKTVATDGHRLALNVMDMMISANDELQVIVPRKGIMELMRLLGDIDEEVIVSLSRRHIRVSSGHSIFTSKLIEGRFPNYNQVIPKNSNKIIEIEKDLLKQVLARIAILCNEKFRGIRFELGRNRLKISATNPEQESAEEELSVDYQDEGFSIGFNVGYLLDILNVLRPGIIQLHFTNPNGSVVIKETSVQNDSTFVVMPMRL